MRVAGCWRTACFSLSFGTMDFNLRIPGHYHFATRDGMGITHTPEIFVEACSSRRIIFVSGNCLCSICESHCGVWGAYVRKTTIACLLKLNIALHGPCILTFIRRYWLCYLEGSTERDLHWFRCARLETRFRSRPVLGHGSVHPDIAKNSTGARRPPGCLIPGISPGMMR